MGLNRILDFLSRRWPALILVAVLIYFNLQPEEKKLIVVENNNHISEQVTKSDSRVSDIWEDGNTFIINNSYNTLYLEEVSYSSNSSYYNSSPTKYTITRNSTYATDKRPRYIFTEPPSSIRVKSGGTVTRWHLHK